MMKKLIALAVTLACLSTMGMAEQVIVPGNVLGLSTLAAMADGHSNTFVSPVSLAFALSMAAEGAAGETLAELEDALNGGQGTAVRIETLNDALNDAGIKWANAAFIDDAMEVRESYADRLKSTYAAELFAMDGIERVNVWVADHTDHLIEHIVDRIDPDVRMLLVNAIAMDARWTHTFETYETWPQTFHAPAGEVEADFMHMTEELTYAEAADMQIVRLDYEASDLCMVAVLPGDSGVPAALSAIAAKDGLERVLNGMHAEKISLSLPRFDITVTESLSNALKARGIKKALSEDAELSGISEEPLYISDILQRLRIQVDETGTRAAAVTEAMVVPSSAQFTVKPPVEVKFDRPFIVLIVDGNTGAICFAGVVADPTAKE